MSRIVMDARSRGSTGRYATKLLQYLQRLDATNEYFVLVKYAQNWTASAPNFHPVIADVKDYTFAEQFKLWWIISRLKPDLVHFTMPQQPLLFTGRSVTTIHDLTMLRWHNISGNTLAYWLKLLVFKFLLWWVAHTSEALITPTRWVKIDITKTLHIDPIRAHVTYEAADTLPGKPLPPGGFDARSEFILFNGNVFPHKNVARLIEAHQSLLKTHPRLRLAIAGQLGQQGEALRVNASQATNINWLGYVPDAQLKWLMEHARAYVYPSLSEGFGLPGLEAMRADTPVVASHATCLPEVYGDAAEYFDPASVEDMAAAIERVINQPRRRKELITLGRARVKQFSWQRMAEQTLAVYRQVLKAQD